MSTNPRLFNSIASSGIYLTLGGCPTLLERLKQNKTDNTRMIRYPTLLNNQRATFTPIGSDGVGEVGEEAGEKVTVEVKVDGTEVVVGEEVTVVGDGEDERAEEVTVCEVEVEGADEEDEPREE